MRIILKCFIVIFVKVLGAKKMIIGFVLTFFADHFRIAKRNWTILILQWEWKVIN